MLADDDDESGQQQPRKPDAPTGKGSSSDESMENEDDGVAEHPEGPILPDTFDPDELILTFETIDHIKPLVIDIANENGVEADVVLREYRQWALAKQAEENRDGNLFADAELILKDDAMRKMRERAERNLQAASKVPTKGSKKAVDDERKGAFKETVNSDQAKKERATRAKERSNKKRDQKLSAFRFSGGSL